MGEAIRKESSMEDILASIRKIISSETAVDADNTPVGEKSSEAPNEVAGNTFEISSVKSDGNSSVDTAQLQTQKPKTQTTDPLNPLESKKAEQNSTSKSKMSSTLDSIRAAVNKNSSKASGTNSANVTPAALKSEMQKPSMQGLEASFDSTSATPLAPVDTLNVPTKDLNVETNSSPKTSLSHIVEQIQNNNNSGSEMVYSKAETQPDTQLDTMARPEAKAPVPTDKPASASELNFKNFAQSVQIPNAPAKTSDKYLENDVDVFVKEDEISAELPGNPNEPDVDTSVNSAGEIKALDDAAFVEIQTAQPSNEMPDIEKEAETPVADAPGVDNPIAEKTIVEISEKDEDASKIAQSEISGEVLSDMLRGAVSESKIANKSDLPIESQMDSLNTSMDTSAVGSLAHGITDGVTDNVTGSITDNVKDVLQGNDLEIGTAETDKFKDALVSPSTKTAVAGSIDRLKQSLEDVNTAHVENVLRPMLREWLDSNLPEMVEKIVREEISRITQKSNETKRDSE